MNSNKFFILSALSVLVASSLACTINVGGPAYPTRSIPVSTEAAGQLQSGVQTAVAAGADSGQVTFVFTETELTSYLANYLASQSQPLFTDPQVYLQDGQVQIYGTARQGYLEANIQIVVTAGVDAQGQLDIQLASADFGPLPVPSGLKDAITAAVQEAYTGAIGPAAIGFRLESIQVAAGQMTISGRTK